MNFELPVTQIGRAYWEGRYIRGGMQCLCGHVHVVWKRGSFDNFYWLLLLGHQNQMVEEGALLFVLKVAADIHDRLEINAISSDSFDAAVAIYAAPVYGKADLPIAILFDSDCAEIVPEDYVPPEKCR